MKNYWIFVAANYKSEAESFSGRETYQKRMQDAFWGLGERTPNRRKVRRGDQVVFYIARPESSFVGAATLASDSIELTPDQRARLSHGSEFFTTQYGVFLEDIRTWDQPRPVAALALELEFIEDPERWGVYLQGGVRQISAKDYETILSGRIPPPGLKPGETEEQSLFALEKHLEEFIDHNWRAIDWGADLALYHDGEQAGRQYPAGTWNIDFLAVDQKSGDLVVIELKRGKTSDATVGQLLRYLNWVKENVARPDQKVRGIIVASDVDDALRYAAKGLADVDVKTYNVTFSLNRAEL